MYHWKPWREIESLLFLLNNFLQRSKSGPSILHDAFTFCIKNIQFSLDNFKLYFQDAWCKPLNPLTLRFSSLYLAINSFFIFNCFFILCSLANCSSLLASMPGSWAKLLARVVSRLSKLPTGSRWAIRMRTLWVPPRMVVVGVCWHPLAKHRLSIPKKRYVRSREVMPETQRAQHLCCARRFT